MKHFIIGLLVFFGATFSFAGNSVLNGGDAYAAEFVRYARFAMVELRLGQLSPDALSLVNTLETQIEKTQVNTEEKLFLHGDEVDAINNPSSNRIWLSRDRWITTRQNPIENVIAFVLHEYLGVSGINDRTYEKTNVLMQALRPSFFAQVADLNLFAQELRDLHGILWHYSLSSEPQDQKALCFEAGEINHRVQNVSNYMTEYKNLVMNKNHLKKLVSQVDKLRINFKSICLSDSSKPLDELASEGVNLLADIQAAFRF